MKWLLLLVVLLNAAFFGWSNFVQNKSELPQELVYAPPVSEKIRLLSEPENQEQQAEMEVAKAKSKEMDVALNKALTVAKTNAATIATPICPALEVEKTANDMQIVQALKKLGWRFSDKEVMGKRPKYWLYIDAPDTQDKARAIVKDLSGKSIDSFIITRAEMKNRISLGLYSSKERADEASQRIESKSGYKVNIYDHMRTVTLHHIEIEQPLNNEDWEMFLSQFDLTKMMIKIEKSAC